MSSQQQQQFQNLQMEQLQKLKNIRVEVFLIRHGYSIANRSTFEDEEKWFKSKLGLVEKTYEPDPSLTRTGILQSQDASTKLTTIKPDYLFASVLCRAQQTALFMFPTTQKVIVAPHLKEENNYVDGILINSDNKPFEDILTQYEKRHNILSDKDLQRLEYSKDVLMGDCTYNDISRNQSGSIKNFLEKFLFRFLAGVPTTENIFRVAVVCHGGLIKKFLNINDVNNNAVFKVSFKSLLDMQNIKVEQTNLGKAASTVKRILFAQRRKQQRRPSFQSQLFFSGYEKYKVSCDPRYAQAGTDQQIVRLKYPSQQILSKRGDRTHAQLKKIYEQELLQRQTHGKSFGSQSSRIQALIHQIKNPQSGKTSFKKKHPELVKKSARDIKKYFKEHPDQLNKLVLDPDAYQRSLDVIRNSHQLSGNDETVRLINQKIRQRSLRQGKDIFNLILSLPSES